MPLCSIPAISPRHLTPSSDPQARITRSWLQTLQSLKTRDRQPERMDDPALDRDEHILALQGLRRINLISRAVSALWNPIAAAFPADHDEPLRILDIGCGSGDVATGIWKRARQAGRHVQMVGCDISDVAISTATARAAMEDADVRFEVRDVLDGPLPDGYDVICCALFLHHLADDDIICLLRRVHAAGASMFVASDLVRSRRGYVLSRIATRWLSRSPVVHTDGPLSVRAALTSHELHDLTQQAGLEQVSIQRQWPERLRMTWLRETAAGR